MAYPGRDVQTPDYCPLPPNPRLKYPQSSHGDGQPHSHSRSNQQNNEQHVSSFNRVIFCLECCMFIIIHKFVQLSLVWGYICALINELVLGLCLFLPGVYMNFRAVLNATVSQFFVPNVIQLLFKECGQRPLSPHQISLPSDTDNVIYPFRFHTD